MRFKPVLYALGWLLVGMGLAMLAPLLKALAVGEWRVAMGFALVLVALVFIGGSLALTLRGRGGLATRRETIFLLACIWLLFPIAAAVPIYLSGALEKPVAALFEATSGLTTTGATIFRELGETPRAIILWRAQLQWLGGLITVLGFAALIASRRPEGRGSAQPAQKQSNQARYLVLPRSTLFTVLFVYLGLSVTVLFGLWGAGVPVFDAACLAMSSVSTGGFMPRAGTIELYGAPFAEIVLGLAMFAGAVSPLWIHGLLRRPRRRRRGDSEPLWIAGAILLATVIIALHVLMVTPEPSLHAYFRALTSAFAAAASLVTTSGFAVSQKAQEALPILVVLAVTFVGAGMYSTAGGLKFRRLGTLLRSSALEIHTLIFPHSSLTSGAGGSDQHRLSAVGAVWASFALLLLATALLALVVSGEGLGLSASLLAAVSAIANAGPIYELTSTPELELAPTFAAMSPTAQLALCLGMILGRFELLALLSLFNLAYWRG